MDDNILDKTVITGANGMVGSYVDFGIKVNKRLLDVTDLMETMKIIDQYQPRAIIHLAAETDVDRCERDPMYAYFVNAIGTYNVAVAAQKVGAKMVYVSTSAVFDGFSKDPYSQDDKTNPQYFYGRSKYIGEVVVRDISDDYIIARVCGVFGGGPKKDQKFVSKIINQLKKKDCQEIKAINDSFISPTFGKDLINHLKYLIKKDAKGIFHLSNKGVCSRYDMVVKIIEVLGKDVKVMPVDSSYFNLPAQRGMNESMVSKRFDLARDWQKALEEYLREEWLPTLKLLRY